MGILIADSGATKCEWCLLDKKTKKILYTQGLSPYFLNEEQAVALLQKELLPALGNASIQQIFYYGTGMGNPANVGTIKKSLAAVFNKAAIEISDDMLAAARALNGREKGITCNLGTGSFACFYDGKKISKKAPGIGYILGDEGSGAYLGKKLIQYYLYNTLDEDLKYRFDSKYNTNNIEILENVYRKPLANRYLASFCVFLAENRGHYMIENIVEDGLNDFFFHHLCKFSESWKMPVNFTGSIAYGFKDVLETLCHGYEFELGKVSKSPIEGLIDYHS